MTIRYAMMMNTYSKYIPITISSNVSEATVAGIKENISKMPGVDITEEKQRVYFESDYFAHIIGYTGTISADALSALKEEDAGTPYTITDQIGKTGIEKAFEDQLKGVKGSEKITINDSYRVINVVDRIEPTAGNDIYLTIDAELQEAYYKILEKRIAGILISKLTNSHDAGTKGESATGIKVPIYDVYDAIVQNNVIDMSKLNKSKSSLSNDVLSKLNSANGVTTNLLKQELKIGTNRYGKQISESLQDYLDYVYSMLVKKNIILTSNIDKTDKKYIDFTNNKLSTSEFLTYAISKSWIDLEILEIGDEYYSSEELYQKLLHYIFDYLKDDNEYKKLIYHDLIQEGTISGKEICLLLYEQNVLKKGDALEEKLRSGQMDSFAFIKNKIRSLEITPGQLGLEPCSGSIVVTDVNTGKIKAMVSYPSYDNNKFANHVDSDYFNYIHI